VAEGARLESVYTLTGIGGSNPSLSARFHVSHSILHKLFIPHAFVLSCPAKGSALPKIAVA
jgi:hypothetical protein